MTKKTIHRSLASLIAGLAFFVFVFLQAQDTILMERSGTGSSFPYAASTTTILPEGLPHEGPYRIERIVDGDTIVVDKDQEITVRLIGVDTPETKKPRVPVQCFGHEATEFTTSLLNGHNVYLVFDPSQDQTDRYGRTLAYIFRDDGLNVGDTIIREGYGHEYTYEIPYALQQQFKEAQIYAREHKQGLWASRACE